ncbi:pilus assembly protein [Sansalvadorimonas sp. 2012CJ34-2]|uniref:Pilus assembly protein n=1 Tax=Parendozoicomonas callyspongiae TaxID=2942213 RepID=A0ABT0PAW6_9GAMM|nr:TadE/TadG family type IV pilus assembly protein [Sansalvadorimonas sp. 2012CJ34-2]MCL6268520.1 pilus assembly protein [Sansalvadorimonas sp. 2012CJ34-2]
METKRNIKKKMRWERGVVAIEFAIGALAFFMMIFYWIEVSYMGFVSATVDFSVAEASRVARTAEYDDYRQIFRKTIKGADSVWSSLIDESKFDVDVRYFKDIGSLNGCDTDFTAGACDGAGSPENQPLAVYRVSYPYQPIFAQLLFENTGAMNISREVITVQEYERELFKWQSNN